MSKLNIDQQTIKELFSNKKSDFLIPDYQRPYAWEEPECQTLWDDIFVFAFPENDYTDDGQLLGHIVIGTMMVADRIKEIPGFPAKTAAELKHCILAHHGELEYGSPKKPALLEALALNFADNTDAKMETMLEVLKSGGENPGWLGYNRFLETNVRKTTPTE